MDMKRLGAGCMALLLGPVSLIAAGSDARLADAAEKKDPARIRALLEQGVDVNASQVDGMTALHWAVYQDELETAKLLVRSGADAQAANRYGVKPLSLACTNGNAAMVEWLLEAGADPNTTLRGGETVLMTAARTGKIGPVKALLARGADVNAKERRDQTALMWAAAEGHVAVVERLLEAGADFRTALGSGYTPLFFAVREGRTDVAKALLTAGIYVNETMKSRGGGGAKAPRRGTSPLILAVENGHYELAVSLLEAGADPNDQRSGFTPLHTITWVRKPGRGDNEGGNPAPMGSGNLTSLRFVKALIAHGADVNTRLDKGRSGRGRLTRRGATPFLLAAVTADAPLMRLLIKAGADPLRPNAENCTPLMAAAGVGTRAPGEEAGTEPEVVEAVKLILEHGGDINGVDDNGETTMHGAAYKSLPKVVQLLADKGADINVWDRENKWGWTPLLIASGYRVGNFKPAPETIAALHRVMLAEGVVPPTDPKPSAGGKRKGYEAP